MTPPTKILDAARLLGMKPEEVRSVEDSPAGDVITTIDGARLVDVPADNPDAEGKSGVMLLVPPVEPYRGDFPVYVQPLEVDDEPAAVNPAAVPAGTARDVLAWVAGDAERAVEALAVENERPKPRKNVFEELEGILEQAAALAAANAGDADNAAPGAGEDHATGDEPA